MPRVVAGRARPVAAPLRAPLSPGAGGVEEEDTAGRRARGGQGGGDPRQQLDEGLGDLGLHGDDGRRGAAVQGGGPPSGIPAQGGPGPAQRGDAVDLGDVPRIGVSQRRAGQGRPSAETRLTWATSHGSGSWPRMWASISRRAASRRSTKQWASASSTAARSGSRREVVKRCRQERSHQETCSGVRNPSRRVPRTGKTVLENSRGSGSPLSGGTSSGVVTRGGLLGDMGSSRGCGGRWAQWACPWHMPHA